MIFGKVLRMMSHLGEEMRMISQVTRPQNHSKKKNRAKPIKSEEKEKGQNPGCYIRIAHQIHLLIR